MPYQPDTVNTVVKRLNVQYYLPAIQREFVWQPDQIAQLFDSLMRGYPISAFLFWELKPENRDKLEIYKFIENFSPQKSHNELASGDGVQQLTLILDGQQRLTSLLIGLKGSFTSKKKYKRWDSPDAWVKQRLYLDLLHDPLTDDSTGSDIAYGFEFLAEPIPKDKKKLWFKVGRILDYDSEDAFYASIEEIVATLPQETTTLQQAGLVRRNLMKLYQAVWKDHVVSYYIEHDQNYDRVLDIFVRANEGGTKLSKSDLLLSMVTLKWAGMNAREEIYQFVERLNNELSRKNDFDKDFIMKTCLVVSDLEVAYKVDNFSNQNLQTIQSRWSKIKAAIEAAVNLINWFDIDRDTLTSANAVIPIIYYLYHHPLPRFCGGSSEFEVRNAAKIKRWLTGALLNSLFGGTSDNILRDVRKVLRERAANATDDFPAEVIDIELAQTGRTSYANEYAAENFLAIAYGKKLTYLALTLLYDDNHWGTSQAHQDHIFPRSQFSSKKLAEAGIDASKHQHWQMLADSVANLELLLPAENVGKSDQTFEEWLATRDAAFKHRHLIPDDASLLKLVKFEEFIEARRELIKKRLATAARP